MHRESMHCHFGPPMIPPHRIKTYVCVQWVLRIILFFCCCVCVFFFCFFLLLVYVFCSRVIPLSLVCFAHASHPPPPPVRLPFFFVLACFANACVTDVIFSGDCELFACFADAHRLWYCYWCASCLRTVCRSLAEKLTVLLRSLFCFWRPLGM